MYFSFIHIFLKSFICLSIFICTSVWADNFPSKPITLVVAQGSGSGSDVMARLMAIYLGPILGQPVVVENRAGAAGVIGHQSVARSTPDGYTILITTTAGMFVVPAMNANAKYGLADYAPVASLWRSPFAVLVANTPSAPKSISDLITLIKSSPQSYASVGMGTMTHLGSELVLRKAGVQAAHIPYKGSGPALTDLMGGQVLFTTDSLTATMAHIRSGKLRALATTDMSREASLPDVPTLAEAGLPGVQIAAIGGIFAPKGTPKEVVDKLSAAISKVLSNPEVVKRFAAVETEPLNLKIENYIELLRKDSEFWGSMVRQLNLKQD